ncbi:MAG: nucleoside-triphosphatase [Bacteroidales bacterium]|nr:nucleoside-triphosphatase [Bacteroidales bacterium]
MNHANPDHSIFLVTGNVQGGKTSYLSKLVNLLENKNLRIAGFLSPGSFDSGTRSGFRLKDIGTGVEIPLAAVRETPGWFKYRRFWFNPDAFRQGREWIESGLFLDPDVVVIDEVGPMELEGAGWSESLEFLRNSSIPLQIWNVRDSLSAEVSQRWNISSARHLHIEKTDPVHAAEKISGIVKRNRSSNP